MLIKEKMDEISRKGLTEDGMNRKERIYLTNCGDQVTKPSWLCSNTELFFRCLNHSCWYLKENATSPLAPFEIM